MIIIKDKDLTGCTLELCHTALIWVWQCLHPSDQRCAVTFPLCNNMLHHTLSIHHGVYIQLCDSSFPRVEELCHLLTFVICGIFVLSRSYLLPSVLHGAMNPEAALPQLTAASVWAWGTHPALHSQPQSRLSTNSKRWKAAGIYYLSFPIYDSLTFFLLYFNMYLEEMESVWSFLNSLCLRCTNRVLAVHGFGVEQFIEQHCRDEYCYRTAYAMVNSFGRCTRRCISGCPFSIPKTKACSALSHEAVEPFRIPWWFVHVMSFEHFAFRRKALNYRDQSSHISAVFYVALKQKCNQCCNLRGQGRNCGFSVWAMRSGRAGAVMWGCVDEAEPATNGREQLALSAERRHQFLPLA